MKWLDKLIDSMYEKDDGHCEERFKMMVATGKYPKKR
jgi:hypothetical protein